MQGVNMLSQAEIVNRIRKQGGTGPTLTDVLGGLLHKYLYGGIEVQPEPRMVTGLSQAQAPINITPEVDVAPLAPRTVPSLDAVLKQFMEGGYRRASTNTIPSLSKFSVEKTGKGYTVNAKGRPRTNTNTQPQTKQPVTINANMSRDEALRRMVALEGGINARYHTDKGRHAARSAFSKELSQIKSLKPNEVGAWVSNGFGKGTLLTSPEDVYGDERISRAENLASKRGVADLVSSMTRGLLAKYPELKKKNINKLQGDLLQLLSVARPLVDFENVSSEVSDVTNATLNRR